jgi:hypothetical protein
MHHSPHLNAHTPPSPLTRLPTELLLRVLSYTTNPADPLAYNISLISLRCTCRHLAFYLPPPRTCEKESDRNACTTLSRAYTAFLSERQLHALSTRERDSTLRPGLLVCSKCIAAHPVDNFYAAMRRPDIAPEERQCKGVEGKLWLCEHKHYDFWVLGLWGWKDVQCKIRHGDDYHIEGCVEKDGARVLKGNCVCYKLANSRCKAELLLGVERVGVGTGVNVRTLPTAVESARKMPKGRGRAGESGKEAGGEFVEVKYESVLTTFVSPALVREDRTFRNVEKLIRGETMCPHISVEAVKEWLAGCVYEKVDENDLYFALRSAEQLHEKVNTPRRVRGASRKLGLCFGRLPLRSRGARLVTTCATPDATYAHTLNCSHPNCNTVLQITTPTSQIPPHIRYLLLTTYRRFPFPPSRDSPAYLSLLIEPDRPAPGYLHNCPPHCCFERFQRTLYTLPGHGEAACCGEGAVYACCRMETPRCGSGKESGDVVRMQMNCWEILNGRQRAPCVGLAGDACFEWAAARAQNRTGGNEKDDSG